MNTKQWSEVISWLARNHPTLIKIRTTDHEYRTDETDIIQWRGRPVQISVDSLAHDNPQDTAIKKDMLECYKNLTS